MNTRRAKRIWVLWLVAIATTTSARPSSAQAPPAAPPPAPPPFVVQSNDGDNLLQFDVLAQVDGRFALNDDAGGVVNAFTVRRIRPSLHGRLVRRFEFFFNPDFGGGTVAVQDAYFDTVFSTAFRVRVGKSKTPVGVERLMQANSLVFVERALPTALVPNRDVGVQVLGDLAGNRISYMASISNGVTDGASTDTDANGNKEMALRLIGRPFARRTDAALSGLGVGVAGSIGMVSELPVLRTATLVQPFLSYTGATAEGDRLRISPQAFYYYKSFGAFGEYVRSGQSIRRGTVVADIDHIAWNITASYVLTGEPVTERAVRPRTNFDFGGGHVGAVQLAARYHALAVDEEAVTLGLAAPGSSRQATAFTVGVNWYLNPFVKYVLNFERTVFHGDPDGSRPAENAVVFRAQLFF
ncbi:MAG TPA: porin [Vicinamibacterales bacterium]|nr:porin [Vicinamibacterales bacterium]